MKSHPILFSSPMVQALLAGQKTQTRRLLKNQPTPEILAKTNLQAFLSSKIEREKRFDIGDVLWVRETWQNGGRPDIFPQYKYIYKADQSDSIQGIIRWKPSIFMPKDACRLYLKITDIRVERLGDISEEDAIAEGITEVEFYPDEGFPLCNGYMVGKDDGKTTLKSKASDCYKSLWNSIHGEDAWETDKDKWVWVITFERIEKP